MTIDSSAQALLAFGAAAYGLVVLAAWTIRPLHRFKSIAAPSWQHKPRFNVLMRAGTMLSIGAMFGFKAIGMPLTSVLLGLPTLVLGPYAWVDLIEDGARKSDA